MLSGFLSRHKKLDLFEEFENVDYSFGVNFELLRDFFVNKNPLIINQKEMIYNNLPNEYLKTSNKNIKEIIELIAGEKFNDMGQVFLNLSFKYDETIS